VSAEPKQNATESNGEWLALGVRLREIREYLGLSQQAVATATGIPRTAISDIERGERKVDSLEIRKFARTYRYPIAYLLGEQGEPADTTTALARAVSDLTDADRSELLRFAQFLKFNAEGGGRGLRNDDHNRANE
jgi:transcriptional regulator with XRE-family HTH domain